MYREYITQNIYIIIHIQAKKKKKKEHCVVYTMVMCIFFCARDIYTSSIYLTAIITALALLRYLY
jgi:hypothetical protein